jgi:hypothetical protein
MTAGHSGKSQKPAGILRNHLLACSGIGCWLPAEWGAGMLRNRVLVCSGFSTDAAKRFKKVQNATAMIWKLLQVAEKNFRTLRGYWLLSDVYHGKAFVDGVMKQKNRGMERLAA